MDRNLQELADERAIINLATRYCWAIDTGDFEELRQVFLPDAFALLGGTDCHGIDAIIGRISAALTVLDASQHLVGSHLVSLDGDRGTHRCYLQAQHVKQGVEGGDLWMVAGQYEDQVLRTPDGWRIERRILNRIWTDGNPMVSASRFRQTS